MRHPRISGDFGYQLRASARNAGLPPCLDTDLSRPGKASSLSSALPGPFLQKILIPRRAMQRTPTGVELGSPVVVRRYWRCCGFAVRGADCQKYGGGHCDRRDIDRYFCVKWCSEDGVLLSSGGKGSAGHALAFDLVRLPSPRPRGTSQTSKLMPSRPATWRTAWKWRRRRCGACVTGRTSRRRHVVCAAAAGWTSARARPTMSTKVLRARWRVCLGDWLQVR